MLHYKFPIKTVGRSYLRTTNLKIVCVLWLAKRRVCMRVCKHGCDAKMFSVLCPNHASMNLNKFLCWKLEKFTLFTCSLISWNLENLYKHAVSNFFTWTDISSAKNLYFGKHPFSKTRTDITGSPSSLWEPWTTLSYLAN